MRNAPIPFRNGSEPCPDCGGQKDLRASRCRMCRRLPEGLLQETSLMGGASQMQAAAILLRRGHDVALPLVDRGIDLVVDYRIRVQVKSAAAPVQNNHRTHNHVFPINKSLAAKPHVFLFHAWGDDAWWVVPTGEITHRHAVSLALQPADRNTRGRRLSLFYRDAWHVFDEIAERLGDAA